MRIRLVDWKTNQKKFKNLNLWDLRNRRDGSMIDRESWRREDSFVNSSSSRVIWSLDGYFVVLRDYSMSIFTKLSTVPEVLWSGCQWILYSNSSADVTEGGRYQWKCQLGCTIICRKNTSSTSKYFLSHTTSCAFECTAWWENLGSLHCSSPSVLWSHFFLCIIFGTTCFRRRQIIRFKLGAFQPHIC